MQRKRNHLWEVTFKDTVKITRVVKLSGETRQIAEHKAKHGFGLVVKETKQLVETEILASTKLEEQHPLFRKKAK